MYERPIDVFQKTISKKTKERMQSCSNYLCMLVLDNIKCDLLKVLSYLFYRIIKNSAGNQV